MRRLLLTLAVVGLPAAARAGEAEDLRDRVLKAAAKDPAALKKARTFTLKAVGFNKVPATAVPATMELSAVWPGKMIVHWEAGGGKTKAVSRQSVADDRGWKQWPFGPVEDMTITDVNDFRSDAYALWASTLCTLNDAGQELKLAPTIKVGGEAAVGLVITRRPWPEVALHFDEKTLLLRRLFYKGRSAGLISDREYLFDGHKEFAGLMQPTKHRVFVAGKEYFDWTAVEYTFPEKIDPKVFAKP